jgi:hypothetical protein
MGYIESRRKKRFFLRILNLGAFFSASQQKKTGLSAPIFCAQKIAGRIAAARLMAARNPSLPRAKKFRFYPLRGAAKPLLNVRV